MIDFFRDADAPQFVIIYVAQSGGKKRRETTIIDSTSLNRLRPLFAAQELNSSREIVVHFSSSDVSSHGVDERISPLRFDVRCGEIHVPTTLQTDLLKGLLEAIKRRMDGDKLAAAEKFFFDARHSLEFTPAP